MTKNYFLIAIFAVAASVFAGCNNPTPDPKPDDTTPMFDPAVHEAYTLSLPVEGDWVFEGKPSFTVQIQNPNPEPLRSEVTLKILTDKRKALLTVTDTVVVKSGKSTVVLTTPENLDPGFYRASCVVNGKQARANFCFGIDPMNLVSAPDKQSDFETFWHEAVAQLESIQMNATLTEITSRSTSSRKVYIVEMQSVPDGLTGEPVLIHGYYVEPQDNKPHMVIMHFFGYDDQRPSGKLSCPSGGSSTEYAEFYLSTRGQIINNRRADQRVEDGLGDFVNTYGDWFAFNFGIRDAYYYRGAFMDCVQAVRFMASRATSDMSNLFAEGSSQGGAFTYAVAALSPFPFTAIAPCVAFLGDFPDYFDIVSWPGDVAKKNKGSMSNDEMYTFLSYFDTKNLATLIQCPVIACSGLQDGTCPPHTNTAPFNNLPTADKEMYYYPEMGHEIPADWASKYMKFFKARKQ